MKACLCSIKCSVLREFIIIELSNNRMRNLHRFMKEQIFKFLPWEGVMVLKEMIFNIFYSRKEKWS